MTTSGNKRFKDTPNRCQLWDYSSPAKYFISICTQNREMIFGNIENKTMILSDAGKCVAYEIKKIPTYNPRIILDEWVVMPNHIHCIIELGGYDYNNGVAVLHVGKIAEPIAGQITNAGQFHDSNVGQICGSIVGENHDFIVGQIREFVLPTNDGQNPIVGQFHEIVLPPNDEQNPIVGQIHEFVQPDNDESIIKEYRKLRRRMLIPMIIGKFKMQTSKTINLINGTTNRKNWQTDYHEHIIRNENSYQIIKNYIKNNPSKWSDDTFNV